jgi:crotonobetainyl-CoA:carnitine CoA-transferase CaiB-like acyl-CoA transferase
MTRPATADPGTSRFVAAWCGAPVATPPAVADHVAGADHVASIVAAGRTRDGTGEGLSCPERQIARTVAVRRLPRWGLKDHYEPKFR